jgi:hypothetical protein
MIQNYLMLKKSQVKFSKKYSPMLFIFLKLFFQRENILWGMDEVEVINRLLIILTWDLKFLGRQIWSGRW